MARHFAGVMSGTSLDGADAAVARFEASGVRLLGFASVEFPHALRKRLLGLSSPGGDTLDEACETTRDLSDAYAQAVLEATAAAGLRSADIRAIGCHGQTVRHRPERGFTLQLNDPARVAERTGIEVVADFRRRDVAAGGQGAPLAPLFHDAAFRDGIVARAIANIGGIGNVTRLAPGHPVSGFDTGPGNVLMDHWTQAHRGAPFDADGAWAAQGQVDAALLERLLSEPYLSLPPPKSTGRELFNAAWLASREPAGKPEDVQATLAEYTARTIVEAIDRHAPGTREIYLCGGGARNAGLVGRIARLAGRPVADTGALGVASAHVEAVAFAWLAMRCVDREALPLPAVTGAAGPRILGAIYPA